MNIRRLLIVISLGIFTTQLYPIKSPNLVSIRPLITRLAQIPKLLKTSIAKAPKAILYSMRRHKILSAAAITAGALLAIPKTRRAIVKPMQSVLARIFLRLGRRYNSPLCIRLGALCSHHYNIAVNELNDTPLHIAARAGNRDLVRALIRVGAHVDGLGNQHWTPLHDAILSRHIDVVS